MAPPVSHRAQTCQCSAIVVDKMARSIPSSARKNSPVETGILLARIYFISSIYSTLRSALYRKSKEILFCSEEYSDKLFHCAKVFPISIFTCCIQKSRRINSSFDGCWLHFILGDKQRVKIIRAREDITKMREVTDYLLMLLI